MKIKKRARTKMSSPKSKRQRILKTLLIVVAVPVTVFALLLAATPFSQIARGVMFSLVLWQDVSINHIFVFPSREIPTSTASDLPRKLDDTTLNAFGKMDLSFYKVYEYEENSSTVFYAPEPIVLRSKSELDQFLSESETTAFLVVKDNVLVHEWYASDIDPEALHTSFSASKSMVSTVVGMAISDGSISSLDDAITKYVPELLDNDPRFGEITLRHLITMTSGISYNEDDYGVFGDQINTYYSTNLRKSAITKTKISEKPGVRWNYNNYNPQLLGLAVERATGKSFSDYMSEKVWAPMGAEADASWSMDSFYNGFEKMESGLNARPIDFARFGLMFANGGAVNGKQVVPQQWVKEATASTGVSIGRHDSLEQNYSFLWWVYPNNRFAAQGKLGQYIFISPDKETVIVRLGRDENTMFWPKLLLDLTDQLEAGNLVGKNN